MKRFLLFAGDTYYPGGGWQDFKKSFDTVLEAVKAAAGNTKDTDLKDNFWDWWQVVDLQTGKMVEEGTRSPRLSEPEEDD
jgi:hypothetical protein